MGLIKKISDLTTIEEEALLKIDDCVTLIHSQDILTQLLESKDILEIDLLEGKLLLQLIDDSVKYKFIPSEDFNKMVVDTILNKKSELVIKVTDKLKNQLINTYKDIL